MNSKSFKITIFAIFLVITLGYLVKSILFQGEFDTSKVFIKDTLYLYDHTRQIEDISTRIVMIDDEDIIERLINGIETGSFKKTKKHDLWNYSIDLGVVEKESNYTQYNSAMMFFDKEGKALIAYESNLFKGNISSEIAVELIKILYRL